MNPTLTTPGTVYLLHFEKKIGNLDNPKGQAQHYTGFATDLDRRINQHRNGKSGAGIVRAFFEKHIPFVVARTWSGDRNFEKELKNVHKHASRYCPICKQEKTRAIN